MKKLVGKLQQQLGIMHFGDKREKEGDKKILPRVLGNESKSELMISV